MADRVESKGVPTWQIFLVARHPEDTMWRCQNQSALYSSSEPVSIGSRRSLSVCLEICSFVFCCWNIYFLHSLRYGQYNKAWKKMYWFKNNRIKLLIELQMNNRLSFYKCINASLLRTSIPQKWHQGFSFNQDCIFYSLF